MESDLTPALVRAWLEARSLARGLPPPIDDFGGYRLDTHSSTEVCRWVFPEVQPGLIELGRTVSAPRHLIKLCGAMDELCAVLPDRWRPHAVAYFMARSGPAVHAPMPDGYVSEIESNGPRTTARLVGRDGTVVAIGHAAETEQVFVYDRIETDPLHRRKGLGRAVMSLLSGSKMRVALPELLVATEDGRRLYNALGWRTISAYSTVAIPHPHP